ncbi:conserved hypothetical protein [Magnetococcus marinus MC-1]|uniref:Uncharacterized protein n=1 Tax=Magnetococcus marinus (strain ATCC BAA-1437 / JCM 17883 / MC-1) TaxID=156889 RepID=A0LB07_MAGMM|nr:hypothetical protein [Magnetococcus marinus]ABK45150.1 conserved hypothetical protein [Magnetococcus marinus MC-1]
MAKLNMVGKVIGRLVVHSPFITSKPGRHWECRCECGFESIQSTSKLNEAVKKGKNIGCKCAREASIAKAHAEYMQKVKDRGGPLPRQLKDMYDNMQKRCYRPETNRYERYGGRGIKMCDKWRTNRRAFYAWAIEQGWEQGLSIDRIDVDGNYTPENCRFIPIERQTSNTSRNRFLEWNGKSQIVSDWARELGVRPQALQHRVGRGWDLHRMFTQPFRRAKQ